MRKVLIPVAALLLCAAPARAQQALATADPDVAAQQAKTAAAPALYPSSDEVKTQVRANEHRLGRDTAPLGSRDWWYLVAAVAVGVIIAAILL